MEIIFSLDEIDNVAQKILSENPKKVILFNGNMGVGKTTLAQLLSKELNRPLYTLSAISSGVKDVREIIQKVESQGMFQQARPILFIDEIHRFSKSQQDSLLAAVEKGWIKNE